MRHCVILLLAALLCPAPAAAYKRAAVSGFPKRYLLWSNRTIHYVVNKAGCKDVSLQEAAGAIKRSFFTWAAPSCTDVYFEFDGLVATEKTSLSLGQDDKPDGQNLIVWHKTWPPPGVAAGAVSSEMPAVTTVIYSTKTGDILDADIDLNSHDFFWTTVDDPTKVATDVQNILTHEIGHLLGFTHTKSPDATMYAVTSQGELKKRTLDKADLLGLCTVYPFGKTTPTAAGEGEVPGDVKGGCRVGGAPLPDLPALWLCAALLLILRRRR